MIAGESLVWVALCRCDCWGERSGWRCAVVIAGECWGGPGLRGAVPWGLLGRAWSGCRCAVVLAGESLVWVAPCRCDCWGEPGLGGAVPL